MPQREVSFWYCILPMELVSYHMSLPLALARPIITSPVMRALTSMTFELCLQRSLVLVYWCMLYTVRNRNELNLSQQATHKANRTENRRHKRRESRQGRRRWETLTRAPTKPTMALERIPAEKRITKTVVVLHMRHKCGNQKSQREHCTSCDSMLKAWIS